MRVKNSKYKIESLRIKVSILSILVYLGFLLIPIFSAAQEVNEEGWRVPDLRGLVPYSITVAKVDGVEKIVEKFYTPAGGHVARISGNGKIFAYAVDEDQEPPMDYLLLDPDGSGKFTQKFRPQQFYSIPEWVSN